jgi:hypothetical protein
VEPRVILEKNGEETDYIAPTGNQKWQARPQPTILLTDLERAVYKKYVKVFESEREREREDQ